MSPPFAAGSVSLRLYPPRLDDPTQVLDELTTQAALAATAGFDGVMLSERHGGAWGQIPNPLQIAGWLLAAMPSGWVAPCPLLLPFRRAAVVAEELAWLDARFPGRVGAGFGSGGNAADFAAMDVPFGERAERFDTELREVARLLRAATPPHALAGDRAIARVHERGLPLLSAAMSNTAVRRAAALDLGIIGSSLLDDETARRLVDRYRDAGGRGPHVVIARVWLGQPPWELIEQQLGHYREASATRTPRATPPTAGERGEGLLHDDDPASLAERLADKLRATGADACNVRVHVAGLEPALAREQIAIVGAEVVPRLRRAWPRGDR
jgi:alkanesulfonate monooxygenase SsuD/methylene tetrahydromethanopterin reductase-like flavin-dependent oxidoreductase (luciferase family)